VGASEEERVAVLEEEVVLAVASVEARVAVEVLEVEKVEALGVVLAVASEEARVVAAALEVAKVGVLGVV
jgi:hypothetical protein